MCFPSPADVSCILPANRAAGETWNIKLVRQQRLIAKLLCYEDFVQSKTKRPEPKQRLFQPSFVARFGLPASTCRQHQCFMQKGAGTHSAAVFIYNSGRAVEKMKTESLALLWTGTLFSLFTSSSIPPIEARLRKKLRNFFMDWCWRVTASTPR